VASGDDGIVRAFSGKSFRLLDSIRLDRGANRIRTIHTRDSFTRGMEERMRDKITVRLRLLMQPQTKL
jgi:hypothetical protein